MPFIASYLLAFGATLFLLWFLRPLSRRIGLVDVPDRRKTHDRNTPLVGGLAMFVGFSFALLTIDVSLSNLRSFFAGLLVLVVVGVLDDMHDLSSYAKFLAQITAAAFMGLWGNVVLHDLGNIMPWGLASLGAWSLPFTIFSAVGVINALNMVDGMDGLAGSLALVAILGLIVTALHAGHWADVQILIVTAIVVVAFLLLNARFRPQQRALIFMGDSGSMFLGFVISWYVIDYSQGSHRIITPVTALWLLSLPLFDTVYLMFRRILRGESPFAADRFHLHHLLQAYGLSVGQTLFTIVTLAVALAIGGVYGYYAGVSEAAMFYGFLGMFALYFTTMNTAWWWLGHRRRGSELRH